MIRLEPVSSVEEMNSVQSVLSPDRNCITSSVEGALVRISEQPINLYNRGHDQEGFGPRRQMETCFRSPNESLNRGCGRLKSESATISPSCASD